MKKDNFKKAKCIEMYDSLVALTTYEQNYLDEPLTGRSEMSYKPTSEIHLSDIAMIADLLNFQPKFRVKLSPSAGKHSEIDPLYFGKDRKVEDIAIPINKTLFDVSDDLSRDKIKIISLECEVLSEKMLNIRITSLFTDTGRTRIETISYCGSYTIWWENGEDEFKDAA